MITCPVEWYANGELLIDGRLTEEQITTITSLIEALSTANELLYEDK